MSEAFSRGGGGPILSFPVGFFFFLFIYLPYIKYGRWEELVNEYEMCFHAVFCESFLQKKKGKGKKAHVGDPSLFVLFAYYSGRPSFPMCRGRAN